MGPNPRLQHLLVFGDSLSDGGNARAALGDRAFLCPPHWANRRCDGPLWVEHLARELGLPPLVPSLAGGTNHAFGGARSGPGTSPKGLPSLLLQVQAFTRECIGPVPASTLVVLRAGANDYLEGAPGPAVGDAVNGHLLAAVEALAARGFRRFLLPNELPWGCSPIALPGIGEPERRALNALIARQNTALAVAAVVLAARLDLEIAQPDAHGLLLAVLAEPEVWGFREVHRPALQEGAEGTAVPDPRGFLWWDGWGHLTSAFHRLLAQRALATLLPDARPPWPLRP